MARYSKVPNEQLRRQRLRRGWSLDDLARAVVELGRQTGEKNLALTAKTVGRWERGESNPRSPYPKLLCTLFGLPAEELGLAHPKSPLADAVLTTVPTAADPSGALVALESGLVAPLLHLSPNDMSGKLQMTWGTAPDAAVVELIAKALASLRGLDDRLGSPLVAGAALELRALVKRLERLGPHCSNARSIHLVSAELSQFLGWLAYDATDHSTARAYYQEGLHAAHEADDQDLLSSLVAHVATLAVADGKLNEALSILESLEDKSCKQAEERTKALFRAVEAKVLAIAGDRRGSRQALEHARRAFRRARKAATGDQVRLYFLDHAEFTAYEAVCQERLGQLVAARDTWQKALAYLPQGQLRDKGRYLAHLARIDAREGRVESACQQAIEGLTLAVSTGSLRSRRRIEDLRSLLDPWQETSPVRDLDLHLNGVR